MQRELCCNPAPPGWSLLLPYALVVVAVAALGLQAPLQSVSSEPVPARALLVVRAAGVVLLTLAAVLNERVATSAVAARSGLMLTALVVVVRLPPVEDPAFYPSQSGVAVTRGRPLVLAVQVVSGLLLSVAAVAFTRLATREHDDLQRWTGAGCSLAAVAQLSELLLPDLDSG